MGARRCGDEGATKAGRAAKAGRYKGGPVIEDLPGEKLSSPEVPPSEVRQAQAEGGVHFPPDQNKAWVEPTTADETEAAPTR